MHRRLPTGTVTFLFTDIDGSTRLLHELGDDYAVALAEHRRILREAFSAHRCRHRNSSSSSGTCSRSGTRFHRATRLATRPAAGTRSAVHRGAVAEDEHDQLV